MYHLIYLVHLKVTLVVGALVVDYGLMCVCVSVSVFNVFLEWLSNLDLCFCIILCEEQWYCWSIWQESNWEENNPFLFVVCVYWPNMLAAFIFKQIALLSKIYQAILFSKSDSKIHSLCFYPVWRRSHSISILNKGRIDKVCLLTFRATFSILIKSFRCATINCCVSSKYYSNYRFDKCIICV